MRFVVAQKTFLIHHRHGDILMQRVMCLIYRGVSDSLMFSKLAHM